MPFANKTFNLFRAGFICVITLTFTACDSGNNASDANTTNEAEVVGTDTVEYVPEGIDSLLVTPDTIVVTPDTAGVQGEIDTTQ